MTFDVFPTRATFAPGEDVEVVVVADRAARLRVSVNHLGVEVTTAEVTVAAGRQVVALGVVGTGGHQVLVHEGDDLVARTALDVLVEAVARPRYGFIADFPPGRDDVDDVADHLRRMHLNVVQFYDWMYRHHDLLPPGEVFRDLLDRELSIGVVRRLVAASLDVGALPIAYGAVYGAGPDFAADHPEDRLHHLDGTPWSLGDLLAIMDLSPERGWSKHVIREFRRAIDEVGFRGIHLDQYGDPKRALGADGETVDLAAQFPAFIDRVRDELSDAVLIFNNVNAYPVWTTDAAAQDATYIEVWSPHDGYADLADLVTHARLRRPDRPVILAAYLEPFAGEDPVGAVWAARLAMATIFAHGGHHLLCGEVDGVLVHPYYPDYATVDADASRVLRAHLDAAVALGDLLYDPGAAVATRSLVAGVNEDVRVRGPVPVTVEPEAGALWVVVTESSRWTVVHLIDLSLQADLDWNVPKRPAAAMKGVMVDVVATEDDPEVLVATIGEELAIERRRTTGRRGDHLQVEVPTFEGWAVVAVPRR